MGPDIAHPAFRPDPDLSREEMEALQRDIADTAVFEDDIDFDPRRVRTGTQQTRLGDGYDAGEARPDADACDAPTVVGIDQAFLEERAVSAVVATRAGEVVERAHAVTPLEIPYVPGLLAFREGEPILAALSALADAGVGPDLLVVDGSGRIHFRQAGIATHVGVLLDVPAVGVAKNLLCGTPARSVENLPEGERVPIEADDAMDAPAGTVVGHALQSRQYDSRSQSINPLYVSPGHRLGAETATGIVERCCDGYKLPEPTRLADAHADEVKEEYG